MHGEMKLTTKNGTIMTEDEIIRSLVIQIYKQTENLVHEGVVERLEIRFGIGAGVKKQ